jgi:hypothetical protein
VNDIKMGFKERGCGVDSCGPKCGPVAWSFEHGNEPSGSLKSVEFSWLSSFRGGLCCVVLTVRSSVWRPEHFRCPCKWKRLSL